ncbi:hypothetical protein [Lacticaseibacillus sp. N501-2]|uniref:hypothetical protein n=1 Tax=Lacticaseibacillus salsurae TaxID=3367729 RepID=UPI0038B22E9C
MANVDKKAQALIDQVLHRAGVLKTDGDANELRRYAIKRYRRMNERKSVRTNDQLLEELTKAVRQHRYRGWPYQREESLTSGQQQAGRYPWLETKPTRNHELAHMVQLSPKEREVMYLLVVAGRSTEEIVAELGVSKDWVAVTINKIKHIYGQVR